MSLEEKYICTCYICIWKACIGFWNMSGCSSNGFPAMTGWNSMSTIIYPHTVLRSMLVLWHKAEQMRVPRKKEELITHVLSYSLGVHCSQTCCRTNSTFLWPPKRNIKPHSTYKTFLQNTQENVNKLTNKLRSINKRKLSLAKILIFCYAQSYFNWNLFILCHLKNLLIKWGTSIHFPSIPVLDKDNLTLTPEK